ncbi:MAG: DUF2058 family protein, partial [Lysobacter sp.]|nr:DUF2058 family protein [Lysobacter sp.]
MTDSLRDQLLGLGFKPAPPPERKPPNHSERGARSDDRVGRPPDPRPKPQAGRAERSGKAATPDSHQRRSGLDSSTDARSAKPRTGQVRSGHARLAQGVRTREDIDLARAYAIRAQREKDERVAAEQAKQEQARERREARARLAELVKDKVLNAADADIARHFPYGGKIKRVYVTPVQLKALNAGELGVLQMDGRYVLVDAAVMAEAQTLFAPAIALLVDPDAPAQDDPYA